MFLNRKSLLFILIFFSFENSVFSYVQYYSEMGMPLKWFQMPITYVIDKKGCADIPDDSEFTAIYRSFETWENVECVNIDFEFEGFVENIKAEHNPDGKNENLIIWIKDKKEWLSGKKEKNMIALTTLTYDKFTGQIVDADIELNDWNFYFTTTTIKEDIVIDVQNTMTHEIGHMLGLDHSDVAESTMYETAPSGDTKKRDLHKDDIDGVCHIYGKNQNNNDNYIPDNSTITSSGCSMIINSNEKSLFFSLLLFISMLLVFHQARLKCH